MHLVIAASVLFFFLNISSRVFPRSFQDVLVTNDIFPFSLLNIEGGGDMYICQFIDILMVLRCIHVVLF